MPSDLRGERAVMPSDVHHEWARRLTAMDQECLREDVHRLRDRADHLSIWSRGRFVPVQPFVLSPTAAARLQAIARDVHRLVVDQALACAAGDLRRLADHVRWPDSQRWVLDARTPLGPTLGSSRTDVMISGGVPRVLELNIGTCLNGSTSTPVLTEALLDTSVGRRLGPEHDLGAGSFLAGLARWLRAGRPDAHSRVALVSSIDASDEGSRRWAEHQVSHLAGWGITADLVPVEEMDISDGTLRWGGHRYPQAVRYFMLSDSVERHRDAVAALERCEGTDVYGGFLAQLFTSKAILADLCRRRDLTPADCEVLAHVPWTARLDDRGAHRDGLPVDPAEWAADNRDRAVLKPFHLFGSRGVTVGRFTDDSSWRQLVQDALASGDHVVQEIVEPDAWPCAYWSLDDDRLVTVDGPICLGPYRVGGADGGTMVQQPLASGWPGLPGTGGGASLGTVVSPGWRHPAVPAPRSSPS